MPSKVNLYCTFVLVLYQKSPVVGFDGALALDVDLTPPATMLPVAVILPVILILSGANTATLPTPLTETVTLAFWLAMDILLVPLLKVPTFAKTPTN